MKKERGYDDSDGNESSDEDKENRHYRENGRGHRKINEDKTLQAMKGSLTKENYYIWRTEVLTHMDTSYTKLSEYIRHMETATIEEVRRGDHDLPRVKDKALWALFYNVWLKGKLVWKGTRDEGNDC